MTGVDSDRVICSKHLVKVRTHSALISRGMLRRVFAYGMIAHIFGIFYVNRNTDFANKLSRHYFLMADPYLVLHKAM